MEKTAKFREIADHYRALILRGDMRAGEELPSERALALEHKVARPTATRALELLRREGLAVAVQGSGTFVADHAVNLRASDRYARAKAEGRIYASGEKAEILRAEMVEDVPDVVRTALGLPARHAAIMRRRITRLDGQPQEVSTSWFDGAIAATCPGLLVRERILGGTVAYVEERAGRRAAAARDRMSARAATEWEADALGLPQASPVLATEHLVLDDHDRPLEFVQAIYPPGRWAHEHSRAI